MIYTPAPRDPKQPPVRINLLSDTQTRPTPGMREAMAREPFTNSIAMVVVTNAHSPKLINA